MSHGAKCLLIISLAALLSGTLLSGCSLLPREESAMQPPLVKPKQEDYDTVKAAKGTIAVEVKGQGIFESTSTDAAQFTAQGGRIEKVFVKSGDSVKKGDMLIQLRVDGLDLQVKEQALALEKAKYAAKQAKANSDDQTKKITDMQLDIEQTKYDRLLQTYNSKQLKAQLDGQVVFVAGVKPGDMVDPYQTLVIAADPTQLHFALHAGSPNDIKDVEVGMPAEVKMNSETVIGKVVQIPFTAPAAQNKDLAEKNAKTLYIDLPKLPNDAAIGKSADVTIPVQKRENVIKIPISGLRSYLGRNFVQVLEEGKRLREIDVETGIRSYTEVEITMGLSEGQDIVLQN